MALRQPEFPSYRERVALQVLQNGDWTKPSRLHPAGEVTLDNMAAKGWIEKDGVNGVYRITKSGRSALLRKIPLGNGKRTVELPNGVRRTKAEREVRKATQAEEARLALIEHDRAQRLLLENMERLRSTFN